MAEPSTSTAAVAIGSTAVAAAVDSYLGKEVALVVLVVSGALIGASGGCIASHQRGIDLALRGLLSFFVGLFSSFFVVSIFSTLPPALMCAIVSFVAVEPKENVGAVMALVDKVRGKTGGQS